MAKYKVGDVLKNADGEVRTIKRVDETRGRYGSVYHEYNNEIINDNSIEYVDTYWKLLKSAPKVGYVHLDENGTGVMPEWVKPGYYKRTDNSDGSILLEPLMTRAEWEAAK